MRILEVTNYTAGGCGVGMRVVRESKLLAQRGHQVTIFSTNYEKGTEKTCPSEEKIDHVLIKRFPAKKLGGESYMKWNFMDEALLLKPDIIITHAYRHLHNSQAIKVAKKLGCKVFLVTHAPFGRENSRSFIQNLVVSIYDLFNGKRQLKQFNKIITISKWENKYLRDLGINDNKIAYIPNGISEDFFKPIKTIKKNPSKIIYTGRISQIKNLEVVCSALAINPQFSFKIMGPADTDYLNYLKKLISAENLSKIINIIPNSYNFEEQISQLDKSDIFILPSKSEGMPQTLVEAMARGRIVLGSDNKGNKELIKDFENGFLFKLGNEKNLAGKLDIIKSLNNKNIKILQRKARETAEKFRWSNIIDNLEKLILN